MTAEGSYKSDRQPLELEEEIGRLKAQAQIIWEKEFRTLGWFGLRDGMEILDAGSGPGFTTELLLEALPGCTITALEVDPTLAEYAISYLRSKGYSRYRLVQASVLATGLPDNSFDFAYARYLYQHLPDANVATRELFRILKPGGILVVHDRDAGLKTLRAPENQVIEQVYAKAEEVQASWGGDPKIGRKLWRILSNAGFTNLDLELLAIHSDAADVDSISWLRPEVIRRGLEKGWSNEKEAQVLLDALTQVNTSREKYLLQPNILVKGQKPV